MVDAEEAAARERDVPRRLLGEHRCGPPGSGARCAPRAPARSRSLPLALGPLRPRGRSSSRSPPAEAETLRRAAAALFLVGRAGAGPARAAQSERAGNGRALRGPWSPAPGPETRCRASGGSARELMVAQGRGEGRAQAWGARSLGAREPRTSLDTCEGRATGVWAVTAPFLWGPPTTPTWDTEELAPG